MDYIQHQFTESDQRYDAYGTKTILVALASDRKASLQTINDTYILAVERRGMPVSRLFMSEKMFYMVRDTIMNFNPREQHQSGLLEVQDEYFDGDFLRPGALRD